MAHIRFSLKFLFGLVAIIALVCQACSRPTPLIAMVVACSTIIILCAGAVIAVVGRGSSRAFWRGFSTAGILYWWLAVSATIPSFGLQSFLWHVYGVIKLGHRFGDFGGSNVEAFVCIALCLTWWPISYAGGLLGRHVATRSKVE